MGCSPSLDLQLYSCALGPVGAGRGWLEKMEGEMGKPINEFRFLSVPTILQALIGIDIFPSKLRFAEDLWWLYIKIASES